MKNLLTTLLLTFSCTFIFAQSPESVSYQAILRNASNALVTNQAVASRVSILSGSPTGTAVYVETHSVTSNVNGLITFEIGNGTLVSGNFSTIDWGNGPFFIQTETDPAGGTNYTITGTSQLLSVPYALHANTADSVSGGFTETDPVYGASLASSITSADTTRWGSAGADGDWTVATNDMHSAVTGNVGIGTTTPANKLDVAGVITVSESANDEMVINNDDEWTHSSGLQDFGDGGDHFMVASREGSGESAGIYGDGDHVTLWSPGDGAPGQPGALVYVCDEDSYNGAIDSDPFNNAALDAYLNTSGNWVAPSDINRKENIVELGSVMEELMKIKGYTYNFKLVEEEIEKGDVAPLTYGVIAQEVIKYFPELVDVSDGGYHYVSYTEFIPILIKAVQEQQTSIEQLQAEKEALNQRLEAIEQRLDQAGY